MYVMLSLLPLSVVVKHDLVDHIVVKHDLVDHIVVKHDIAHHTLMVSQQKVKYTLNEIDRDVLCSPL